MRLPIADVDAWLASIDPVIIDRWLAFDQLEPISSPWQHTATICSTLWNAVAIVAAANGIELPHRSADDWIPDRSTSVVAGLPTEPRMDADQVMAAMNRKFQ